MADGRRTDNCALKPHGGRGRRAGRRPSSRPMGVWLTATRNIQLAVVAAASRASSARFRDRSRAGGRASQAGFKRASGRAGGRVGGEGASGCAIKRNGGGGPAGGRPCSRACARVGWFGGASAMKGARGRAGEREMAGGGSQSDYSLISYDVDGNNGGSVSVASIKPH